MIKTATIIYEPTMIGWISEVKNEKGKRIAHCITDTLEENIEYVNSKIINREELRDIVKSRMPIRIMIKWGKT